MNLIYKAYLIFFLLTSQMGCTKFVQVSPPITEVVGTSAYSTNSTAASTVTGIYLTMSNYGQPIGGGIYGISALLGVSADEFTLYPNGDQLLNQTYTNSLRSSTSNITWNNLYNCLYQANSAIDGISRSSGVTASMKQQLIGESLFVRALCNFYLVNLYGDIPLVKSTDYNTNAILFRTPQDQVYQQIVSDLKGAQDQLGNDYLAPDGTITTERARPNKGAATALLARVYLYEQKWDSAEVEATSVINNASYNLLGDLDSVFLANSNEAIWQLEVPNNGNNTPDAQVFLLSYYGGPNPSAPFVLSDSLVYNFESEDLRLSHWIDSIVLTPNTYYFPFKYKLNHTGAPPEEYTMILRFAEQFLIRAEARAQLNKLTEAVSDLNAIRIRSGLPPSTASNQQDIINAIFNERRFEFFSEFGQRWLDLKRSGNINAVMNIVTPQKGGVWKPTAQLFPLPLTELQRDPNLIQNPGYN